jgi:hypothetical protein
MLGLPAQIAGSTRPHLRDLLVKNSVDSPITIANHCYGCTAGQGSSCGGALEETPAKPVIRLVTAGAP